MAYNAGEAFLQIMPSFKGVAEAIEAQAKRWGVTSGRAYGKAFNDEVKGTTGRAPLGPTESDSTRQGTQSGGKFADGFKARVTAALRSLPPVEIGVATTEAEQKFRDLRVELAELSNKRIGVDIDENAAVAQIDRIKAELDRLAAESPSVSVRMDTRAASAQLDKLKAEIAEPVQPIPVRADITDAAAKIADVKQQMRDISEKRIGVDLDEAGALAQLDRLQAELDDLARRSPSVSVRMDTAAASAELAKLRAEIDSTTARTETVHSSLDSVGGNHSANIDVITGPALAAIGVIKTALLGLAAASVITPIIGGLGAILGPLTAAGAGIGVVGASALPGLSAVKNAYTAQSAASKEAATSAGTSAKAQVSAANQIKSAQLSLADTERRIANDRVSSQEAVQKAVQGVARAGQQAAQQQAAANAQVQTAEVQLASAQRASLAAQQALTAARDAATRSLQDQAFAATDAGLQLQADQLALTQAQQNLDAVNANANSTALQRAQAALGLKQAQQQLVEQQATLKRATEDNTKAQKAGVAGSPQVIAANKTISTAQQQQAAAVKALSDAHVNQAQVRQSTAQSVTAAEQTLTDARRAQSQQQAQDASDLTRAQMALTQAQIGAESSTASGTKATRRLAAAMAALTPQERALFDATNKSKTAFTGWARALEPEVLPLFTGGLSILTTLLPKLTPLAHATAGALSAIEQSVAKAATGPGFTAFLDSLTSMAGPALISLSRIGGNLAGTFGHVVEAFQPLSTVVLGGLEKLTGQLDKASASPGLARFVKVLSGLGPIVVKTFGDIGGLAGKLLTALAPLAGPTLSVIDTLARALSKLVDNLAGPFKQMFDGLSPILDQLIATLLPPLTQFLTSIGGQVPGLAQAFASIVVALLPLLPVLAQMVTLAAPLLTALAPLAPYLLAAAVAGKLLAPVIAAINFLMNANPIVLVVLALAALTLGFLYVYNHSKTFHDFVNNNVLPVLGRLWSYLQNTVYPILKKIAQDALAGFESALKTVSKAVSDHRAQLGQLANAFKDVVDFVVKKVLPLIGPVLKEAFKSAGTYIAGAITVIADLVRAFAKVITAGKSVAKGVVSAFGGIKTGLSGVWRDVETIFTNGVNFVTQRILNPLIEKLNKVLGPFGVHIDPIPALADPNAKAAPKAAGGSGTSGGRQNGHAYATGGVLPGYTPGRDVHRFVSPTAGVLDLSGGEGILRPEVVAALGGAPAIHALNAPFNGGRAGMDRAFFGGGVLGAITDNIRGGAASAAISALRVAEKPIEGLVGQVPVPLLRTVAGGFLSKLNGAVDAFIRGTAANQAASAAVVSGPNSGTSLDYAKIIIQQAKSMSLGVKGAEVGLMTALVESNLKNYANANIAESLRLPHDAVGSDHYSAGLFQQQTGPFGNYWGSVSQVMNPAYSAHRFFDELVRKVPGWQNQDSGVDAQTVQVSARPGAYSQRQGEADNLIKLIGYDSGGYLPPGITTVFNGTGRPEPVFTAAEFDRMFESNDHPTVQPPSHKIADELHIHGVDVDAAATEIQRRQWLNSNI